jgi:hypothetical protein
MLDSEFTRRGKIEYTFYALDTVSVVFIEVKKTYIAGPERLDVIAQVLAESAGILDFPFPFRCSFRF